ncbi:MAG: hypothetical protein D6719_08500 [Candidatus Dadabacteria bacterium]|nr:MAG: hypothetical protein D6719_08500 [Candidatus Dadabacteria bacterium]
MNQEPQSTQSVELNNEIYLEEGVCFDPDNVVLEGVYRDQLSAYRAKRTWIQTFESTFLLDPEYDFEIYVVSDSLRSIFILRCQFITACARYAFWRLTNGQAPEAQYLIETAHIPGGISHRDDFLFAPDLKPVANAPLVMAGEGCRTGFESVKELLSRILKRIGSI